MRTFVWNLGLLGLAGAVTYLNASEVLNGHTRDVHAVACSADGKRVISGSEDRSVLIWDAGSRQKAGRFSGEVSLAVAISADGKRIASGERYNKVRLLDPAGAEIKTLDGHTAAVIAVGFGPDSKTLLSFSKDGEIRTWDA